MVSHRYEDAIEVVRRGLTGQFGKDDHMRASTAALAERLERVNRLGGMFEQISFSPQMEAFSAGQLVGAAGYDI
jgi:hypothetical protein